MSQDQVAIQDNSKIYQPPFVGKFRDLVFPKFSASMVCLKPVAKVVEDEPGLTRPDFSDQVSVQSIVDQNKDYCGLAYALRQINGGRLLPNALVDNGRGSVDLSLVPDNVNDAYRLAEESSKNAMAVQNELGLGIIDARHIEEYVTKAVNERINAIRSSEVKKDE